MTRDGALRPAPEDLGQAADIDSFGVEPGVILLERFCALDRVRRAPHGWTAPITDLQRRLGNAPHHRLAMEFLRVDDATERRLHRAVRLASDLQPVVHGWIRARDGVILLTDPPVGAPVTAPLAESESSLVALALTGTLSQLHAAGVTGVAFSPESLYLLGREVRVGGYEHVVASGTAEEDVHRLAEFLELLSGGSLAEVLRPTPTSALELWERLRSRRDPVSGDRLALPATPPFVGREELLAKLTDFARKAKGRNGHVVFVHGEPGMGRTRLLRRLEVEVDRWVDALVVGGTFKVGAPGARTGFVEVLATLAQQPTSLANADRDALRERIRVAAGPLLGMVAGMDPVVAEWLGTQAIPTNLQLAERFGQHAATVAAALRALGTARRPCVVLLDDVDLADPGSRAVMAELLAGPRDHHTLVVATCVTPPDGLPQGPARVDLDLGPLDRIHLKALLEQTVPRPLAEADDAVGILWQASRGQPREAWSAMQEWAARGAWVHERGVGWHLVAERIDATGARDPRAARWAAMPPHQQWLVLAAALRAGRATVPWLVEVLGWNETEVRTAVDAAIDANLVVIEPDGGLRFVDDHVRRMVEREVSAEIRTNAHRQIADWLDGQPGSSLAQRAWHRELSRPVGRDERLAELHVRGGQELMRIYDLERARWHFDRALARATSPVIWVDALEGRADVALLEGATETALDDYIQGMTYGGDPIRGLEIAAKAVQGFYRRDAPQAAYDLASSALRLAGEPLPKGRLGMALALVSALVGLLIGTPTKTTRVRDALCRLYSFVFASLITERPMTAIVALLRGVRHARGLDTENAAATLALYSGLRAAVGHTRAASKILEDAEGVARRSQKPWGMGVVHHVRSQNEVGDGLYEQASHSLDQAVEQFRAAGDLTIAVFSHTLRAFYGRENQPVSRVLGWVAEAELVSRRQGSRLGLYTAAALRTFLLARQNAPDVRETAAALSREVLSLRLGNVDLVNAHAFLSMAFARLGDADRAWLHAQEANSRLNAGPAAADYMRDAYIATVMAVLAASQPTQEQQRALRKGLAALRRHGRRSPRLGAAWCLLAAQGALRDADLDKAIPLLEQVIARHAVHRQTWYAIEAHRLLADIRQATDTAKADQHRQQAHTLAVALEYEAPVRAGTREKEAPPTPVAVSIQQEPPPRTTRPGTPVLAPVRVEPLVRRLLPAFERAVPRRVSLRLEMPADAQVACNPESLQLLVVNMVLAARDTLLEEGEIRLSARNVRLDQAESARMPGVRSDAHLLIEARALGRRRSDAISGVGICSEITASIGGFLDIRSEGPEVLVLGAYLAVGAEVGVTEEDQPPATSEEAIVLHSDARVRQTVVSALRDLGLRAEGMDPELYVGRWGDEPAILFAEARALPGRATPAKGRMVTIYARGAPVPEGLSLRVPFTIRELQEVVEGLTSPGPTEPGSPS